MIRRLLIGPAVLALAVALTACGDSDDIDAGGQTADGGEIVDADPSSDTPAVGGWVLQSGTVNGEVLVLVPGYDATLDIEADGTIGGTASCNGYGGSADISGGSFTVGEYMQTEMGCEPGPMALESQFLTGLGLASNHEVVDGELRIFGDQVQMRFASVAPISASELVGTEWVMDTLIDGETATSVRSNPTLVLNEDGSFTGSTGCRTLTGTWQLDDLGLQFPSMAADGECDADLVDQDGFVVSALEGPNTVEIDGPRLTLTSSGQQGLGYRSDLAGG